MKQFLTDLFNSDSGKCSEMMYGEFSYNPSYEVRGRLPDGSYGKTGETKVVYTGFGKELKGYDVKEVCGYGGEGLGETYYCVYSISDGNETLYVKFEGWYASYSGAEYEGWSFVTPKEKTITEYV